MALSLNKTKLDNLATDIWKSAERLRGKFKAYEYQSVILPIIVIRRLECVLLAWREAKSAEVLAKRPNITEKELTKLVKDLELNPQQSPFSNKTDWTLRKVYEEDHMLLEENFRDYINGFSRNIDDIIENFTHLKDVVGMAQKSADLTRFLAERKPIIVTTQQKFAWVLEEIEKNPELKKLRVAFLIDEAHRSQEGRMAVAIRLPFRKTDDPDAEALEQDPEEQIANVIREHDLNQLFVAFTATPAPATVTLFGEPFDTYSEAEAIKSG